MGDARRNNFDALRLVAAASVVFSHSFLIADGTQDHEPLIWLTGNQSILGLVGVFVFFAISGFLVTQSFEETGDAWRFLAKRALRIFPGLFVATSLSAFVLAPLAVSMAKAYASDAYRKVAGAGIQLHGGIGFTWEHDLQLYFKRAKASEVAFGDATWQRERIARLLTA